MFLYSLTIQPPNNVVQAVLGQFAGTKEQLIITGAGSYLTLLRPDAALGKVTTVLSHNVFGIIRSLAAFRLAGSNKGEACHVFALSSHFALGRAWEGAKAGTQSMLLEFALTILRSCLD